MNGRRNSFCFLKPPSSRHVFRFSIQLNIHQVFFFCFNCWHSGRRPAELMLPSKTADSVIGRLVSALLTEWRHIQEHWGSSFSRHSSLSVFISFISSPCWGGFSRRWEKIEVRALAWRHRGLKGRLHWLGCLENVLSISAVKQLDFFKFISLDTICHPGVASAVRPANQLWRCESQR